MVSWATDGLMSGFDPSENELVDYLYHFASPGTTDLNGVTRFQYDVYGVKEANYPNRLRMKATLNYVTADLTAHSNPSRWLVLGAFLAPAYRFADGVTPTPQQILDVGFDKLGIAYSKQETYDTGDQAFTIEGWEGSHLEPGTKYWVLLIPCFYNPNLSVPIRPMRNISVNTMGRALSFWTNRKPEKPVITSPVNGLTVAAGSKFNFKFTSGDPDKFTGGRYDTDTAGVQVAYAALPSIDNSGDPTWQTLTYRRADNNQLVTTSVYMNDHSILPGDGRISILDDLGFPVLFGGYSHEAAPGEAVLPAGSWQIKVRTVDYGNPYPQLANKVSSKYPGDWDMNSAPEANKSEWSDPIRVHVFVQVPPPTPLTPKNSVAVPETSTTRLTYLYRNTANPPFDQQARTIQIKGVREDEESWRTIVDNQFTDETFLDLPPGYTTAANDGEPNLVPSEYLPNPGFEVSGNLGGWTANVAIDPSAEAENVAGVAGAGVHTGTRALRLDVGGSIGAGFNYLDADPLDDGHNHIEFSGWVRMNPDLGLLQWGIGWQDEDGNEIGSAEEGTKLDIVQIPAPGGGWGSPEWVHLTTELDRPKGGVAPFIVIVALSVSPGVVSPSEWIRIDDMSITGSYVEPDIEPLVLEATTEYEWRARVTDTDLEESGYSEPARWWIVPGSGTGGVKPVIGESIDGATLGCGTHRVFIYRRGGEVRVGELRGLTHVDWNRKRDDISDAKVIVTDWDIDCGNLLALLQTWAYEVHIYRDNGYSIDRVWEGPITLLTYEEDSVTIQAKDAMAWPYRRIIRQALNDSGSGDTVTSRAVRILQNCFAPDDPNVLAYLQPIYNASDAKEYRNLPAFSRTAFEEIDDMAANAGLDYTVVGRAILVWGTKSRIGTLPEFRDENLGAKPIVSEYGMSMANVYAISDGNGVYGQAVRGGLSIDEDGTVSGNDETYGLIEMLSSTWASDAPEDAGVFTQAGLATMRRSFAEHSERSIADRYPPPVVVRIPDNTTLNPNTVISIQQLVPGVVVPLRSNGTLRSVVANQKLDSVTVTEESGNETITITLSPFSRDDAGVIEGGEEV